MKTPWFFKGIMIQSDMAVGLQWHVPQELSLDLICLTTLTVNAATDLRSTAEDVCALESQL